MGHCRALHHYHLEDLRLQLHQYFSRCLRRIPGTPIKVITQGGPNYASSNLIYASYHEAFTLYRTGTSSAISILTMLLFIVLLLLEFKFVEKGVYYEN